MCKLSNECVVRMRASEGTLALVCEKKESRPTSGLGTGSADLIIMQICGIVAEGGGT